jgi:hypothetical protein
VGRDLDLSVFPLRGPVVARDQAHAVQPTEVAEHEGITRLRLIRRSFGEPEVPRRVLTPVVRLEEGVLLGGTRLDVGPTTPHPVLTTIDQRSCLGDASPIHHIPRHETSLAQLWRGEGLSAGACCTRLQVVLVTELVASKGPSDSFGAAGSGELHSSDAADHIRLAAIPGDRPWSRPDGHQVQRWNDGSRRTSEHPRAGTVGGRHGRVDDRRARAPLSRRTGRSRDAAATRRRHEPSRAVRTGQRFGPLRRSPQPGRTPRERLICSCC